MGGLGYFVQGLGGGLMSGRANKLEKEKLAYNRKIAESRAARDLIEQGQADWKFNQLQSNAAAKKAAEAAQTKLYGGLMGDMPSGLPFGSYKSAYETKIAKDEAFDKKQEEQQKQEQASMVTSLQLGHDIQEANRFANVGLTADDVRANFKATKDKKTSFSTKDIMGDLDGLYKKMSSIQAGENIMDIAGMGEGRDKALKTIADQINFKTNLLKANTKEQVKEMFQSGDITQDEAEQILIIKFGLQ